MSAADTAALKEFRRREALLSDLLKFGRVERRRRGVRVQRYRLELELGAVQAAIGHLEDTEERARGGY